MKNPWLNTDVESAKVRFWRTPDQRDLPIITWDENGKPNLREILGDQTSVSAWLHQDVAISGGANSVFWGEVEVVKDSFNDGGKPTAYAFIRRTKASVRQKLPLDIVKWLIDD